MCFLPHLHAACGQVCTQHKTELKGICWFFQSPENMWYKPDAQLDNESQENSEACNPPGPVGNKARSRVQHAAVIFDSIPACQIRVTQCKAKQEHRQAEITLLPCLTLAAGPVLCGVYASARPVLRATYVDCCPNNAHHTSSQADVDLTCPMKLLLTASAKGKSTNHRLLAIPAFRSNRVVDVCRSAILRVDRALL